MHRSQNRVPVTAVQRCPNLAQIVDFRLPRGRIQRAWNCPLHGTRAGLTTDLSDRMRGVPSIESHDRLRLRNGVVSRKKATSRNAEAITAFTDVACIAAVNWIPW